MFPVPAEQKMNSGDECVRFPGERVNFRCPPCVGTMFQMPIGNRERSLAKA